MNRFLVVLVSLGFLVSCGFSKKDEPEEVGPSPTRVVGEVTSVHESNQFVLFKRYGSGDIQENGIFSARSVDGRRAVGLVPSGEKLGRYYAADYSKDAELPRVGDLVVVSTMVSSGGQADLGESHKKEDVEGAEENL